MYERCIKFYIRINKIIKVLERQEIIYKYIINDVATYRWKMQKKKSFITRNFKNSWYTNMKLNSDNNNLV